MTREEMFYQLRARCECLCAAIQNPADPLILYSQFHEQKNQLDELCVSIYQQLKPVSLVRLYTMRDESAGYISREDPELNLRQVMNMTDFTDTELDSIACMEAGKKLDFGGITVERTQ